MFRSIMLAAVTWTLASIVGVSSSDASCVLPVFQTKMPSSSMLPTITPSTIIYIQCFSHSDDGVDTNNSVGRISPRLMRGDVILFHVPKQQPLFLKRIVGLPGDRVQLRGGELYINERPVPQVKRGEVVGEDGPTMDRVTETLPDGTSYDTLVSQSKDGWANNTPDYEIPPNHVFVLGDNRPHSADSRIMDSFGFIDTGDLVGKLMATPR